MEIKAQLKKPYTDNQKMDFIVKYNHQLGYVINETNTELQALGYTEEEQANARKEEYEKQFFKINNYGYFRKKPKGYGSAVESLNTAFNIVTVMGKLPANTLTFYGEPDFSKPEQCTEEWLVANSFKNTEMSKEEFAQFYAQFMTDWNKQEHE